MSDAQFSAYEAHCAVVAQLQVEILPHNKQVLFDTLNAAGIAVVTIHFDGSGDSGQMESPNAFGTNDEALSLPQQMITIKDVDLTAAEIVEASASINDCLEQMAAYDFLEGIYAGWENDDGAYGEFRFALADRSITLEYNERYTDTNYYEHEF